MTDDLDTGFSVLRDWLFREALPLWSDLGTDRAQGGFFEKLTVNGRPTDEPRRARVVGRQIYAFATAETLGWDGPARDLVRHGLEALERHHLTADARVVPLVAADGNRLSEAFDLYDQAFVLFGLAAAAGIGERRAHVEALAERLRARMIADFKHPLGGFEEGQSRVLPLRANPHMHIFEASLAWVEVGGDPGWQALADEIAELCLSRFLDPETGALREYFDGDWGLVGHDRLDVVEPGHQAEWAWLLIRWGLARQRPEALAAARRLVEILEGHGISPSQNLAVNELDRDLALRDPLLRLWPQTERIKARVALSWLARDAAEHAACAARIAQAAHGLLRYFDHPVAGAWWEHLDPRGQPMAEPARASSLYHITCAVAELAKARTSPAGAASAPADGR